MTQLARIGSTATVVERDENGVLRVTYHGTPVVTVFPDGKIVLNHGGWMSVTTKVRMNQASSQLSLGFSVFQKDFAWFVEFSGETLPFDGREITLNA